MDRRMKKNSNTNIRARAGVARSAAVRPLFFATLLAGLVMPVAHAAPTGPQREVAGRIAMEPARPVEQATPTATQSAPPATRVPAARITPPAKLSTAGMADKPLKLDADFASAKRIVPFAFNKVGVGPRGKAAVKELLPLAKKSEKVYVRGRTDGTGDTPSNRKVAHDRAYTVFKAFRNGGIERKKLRLTYCSHCYVASNDTEEGRRLNRRVEVEMIMPREEIARLPQPVHAPEAPPPLPLASSPVLQVPPSKP
jgi:outer membrane protein OmpA-like peptidoglycan-associated protein